MVAHNPDAGVSRIKLPSGSKKVPACMFAGLCCTAWHLAPTSSWIVTFNLHHQHLLSQLYKSAVCAASPWPSWQSLQPQEHLQGLPRAHHSSPCLGMLMWLHLQAVPSTCRSVMRSSNFPT